MTFALGLLRVVPIWAWALAAALAWGGWQRHTAASATKAKAAAEQRAALETANAKAEREAREKEHQFAESARRAADAYQSNLARNRAAAAGARDELDRLRDAIAAAPAGPASSASASSGRADGAAVTRLVLGECARAVQALAETADGLEARLIGLQGYVRSIHGDASPAPR